MHLAVLTALVAQKPLIIRSGSDTAQFELAQICAAYSLECETIEPHEIPRTISDASNENDVNVLIIKSLHLAHRNIQVQAIELLRKKAKQNCIFLLIALLPITVVDPPYLTPHLVCMLSPLLQSVECRGMIRRHRLTSNCRTICSFCHTLRQRLNISNHQNRSRKSPSRFSVPNLASSG